MRKSFLIFGVVLCLFSGCARRNMQAIKPVEKSTVAAAEASTEVWTEPLTPAHSGLFIPEISVDDVIVYFQEVCLDAEIVNFGDPAKLQRWEVPIQYICVGSYTNEDKKTVDGFAEWLNTVEGFPGIWETEEYALANLRIHFVEESEHLALMGEHFAGTDGAVTFWYNEADEIYDAIISCRTEVDQEVRTSVILEEMYNGLGPVRDTDLRSDSVIYSAFSVPQKLSDVDELLLKLLYHPQMQCGMDSADCETMIRQLYF